MANRWPRLAKRFDLCYSKVVVLSNGTKAVRRFAGRFALLKNRSPAFQGIFPRRKDFSIIIVPPEGFVPTEKAVYFAIQKMMRYFPAPTGIRKWCANISYAWRLLFHAARFGA
ncbi:hypothetical protein D3Z39_04765 [Anaerotruncus colihominis]|uniref:Uncharacterized protein n=1 Tax=Anaerotruncus colihominis TaxID=169435 RepID=A0A845RFP1_9FIRM|nr:hypothetical protein [Anaerotruncus colihominis]